MDTINSKNKNNITLQKEISEVKIDVHSVRNEVNKLETVIEKIDVTLDKITDVSTNLNKMIAVHDSKIQDHSKMIEQITFSAEKRRNENDKKTQEIIDKISVLREDIKEYNERTSKETRELVEKRINEVSIEIKKLQDRIESIERWKWMVIGGAISIGYIISKFINIASLL